MFKVYDPNVDARLLLIVVLLALSMAAFGQSTSGSDLSTQSSWNQSPSQTSGQSLGDAARENQEKKDTEAKPPKVITNASIPKDPDGYVAPPVKPTDAPQESAAGAVASREAAHERAAEQRAAARWHQQIVAQKNVIANLQTQVQELKSSISFVDPNHYYPYDSTSQYAGYAFNRAQAQQLRRLHQEEQQLVMERQKLDEMQEAARHAGMHTKVYDP